MIYRTANWVATAIVLVLTGFSQSVSAQTCGQTQCPPDRSNLYCYDAGEYADPGFDFRYKAKICLVEAGSNLISVRGDLIAVMEVVWPDGTEFVAMDGTIFGRRLYVSSCSIHFPSQQNPYRSVRVGDFAVELARLHRSDYFLMEAQLSDADRSSFKTPSSVRLAKCEFKGVESYRVRS